MMRWQMAIVVLSIDISLIVDFPLQNNKSSFVFMGDTISLVPTVGIFVTMNPGYAGRTELRMSRLSDVNTSRSFCHFNGFRLSAAENLKTLFRPCAMVVPDFALICEIMLVAEGFQEARILARKFITLYTLCKELLSTQDHYDWGLRAIKSVLVVAGALKVNCPFESLAFDFHFFFLNFLL